MQVQSLNRLPLAYVRGKVKCRAVLIKILIDSGNLCSDLISETSAKQLNLEVDVSERKMVGMASRTGKVEILGRAKPFEIYLEGVKFHVIIEPLVVKDLAHPMNLGKKFLRRYKATIKFCGDCTRLGIRSNSVELRPSSFNLTELTVDCRFKTILDWYKFAGKNPKILSQENVLDLRKHKPLPGLNMAGRNKNKILSVLYDTEILVFCTKNTTVRPGTAQAIKVKFDRERVACKHQTYVFKR